MTVRFALWYAYKNFFGAEDGFFMKRRLCFKEYVDVASMLFGMLFGAGNLIFPVHLGQLAGSALWKALPGLLITGVGLPLLGVAALGISKSEGLFHLSGRISRPFGMFFTCVLYLTIGPFFAIPRCATVSFTVGLEQVIPAGGNLSLWLFGFTLAFFAATLLFSLCPGKILTWVGKILNPCFLVFLGILVFTALSNPAGNISDLAPMDGYAENPFFSGFLEGYNTMDVLASLAFGIIVVRVIRRLGVEEPDAVAASTVRAGIFSCLFMGVIYAAIALVGAQSRGIFEASANGGIALAQIARHYLGNAGLFVLAATVTLACLKTAVGLVTSCSETFSALFPKGPKYRVWAVIFSGVSLLFSNLGLSTIIEYSVPVLMFLYPPAIVLIFLSLLGKFYENDRAVSVCVMGFTLAAAVYDLLYALPNHVKTALHLEGAISAVGKILPFSDIGLGWLVPAAAGLLIGLCLRFFRKKKRPA